MSSAQSFGNANSGLQAGIINGSVTTQFHAPQERPETPPNPSSTIPFRPNADFVDLEELLDQIRQNCAVLGSWTALVGLGGVGKSQLAIEYAYQIRERSPGTWVFWVHASNAARFEQGYRDIADIVKIAGRQDPNANIFKLVRDWLRDGRKGKWLLILDNVDDARFLHDTRLESLRLPSNTENGASRPLREYLPQCQNGSILITSRNRNAALKLVEQKDIISVEPMDETQALALFERKLGSQCEHVAELAAELEYMPLAISQAAAYISQRAPRCSVRQYLETCRKSDREKIRLLNTEADDIHRDCAAKNAIMITWQISFNHLRQTRPSAADLLSLMSFFDRQGIPEALVRHRGDTSKANPERHRKYSRAIRLLKHILGRDRSSQPSRIEHDKIDHLNDGFEDDVLALQDYSFISADTESNFEMHRLVQLATQNWLAANGQLGKWRHKSIKNLYAEFPKDSWEFENWAKCQELFPHAKLAAAQRPEEAESLRDWAEVLYRAAWFALKKGNPAEAEKMAAESMKVREIVLGDDHQDTLRSLAIIARANRHQGLLGVAIQLEEQLLEARRRLLGVEHLDTLMSMEYLAISYSHQGRLDEAEELEVQVLEARQRLLGVEHLDTLTSMGNLASLYNEQGRIDEAEKLEVQVLEARQRLLGAEHPNTLMSKGNLARLYRFQSRLDEAEELEIQVLVACRRLLGAEHPDTLTSMRSLGVLYCDQGRFDQAEGLQVEVLMACQRLLRAEHPETLRSMNNLAITWKDQGRLTEAIELMEECLRVRTVVLGFDHPNTLNSTGWLIEWKRERDCRPEVDVLPAT